MSKTADEELAVLERQRLQIEYAFKQKKEKLKNQKISYNINKPGFLLMPPEEPRGKKRARVEIDSADEDDGDDFDYPPPLVEDLPDEDKDGDEEMKPAPPKKL